MKKLTSFILMCIVLVFSSCENDLDLSTSITYVKAEAIYGNLNEIRNTPLVSPVQELENPVKVYVDDELLLIGEEGKGIHVFDNSDPEMPEQIYFMNIPGNREFYVTDAKIYAESMYDLLKIDISNPNSPIVEERLENAFGTPPKNDVNQSVIGFNFVEVTEENVSMDDPRFRSVGDKTPVYVDYKENVIPRTEIPVSFAGNSNSSIATVNRIAYINDHVYVIGNREIFTFSDTGELQLLSKTWINEILETIYPQDDALFVGTRNSMEIFSLTDPGQPKKTTTFTHATACDPVLPNGDVAYVTIRGGTTCGGAVNGLFVIDVQNLSRARGMQSIDMESPYGMTIINDLLYVGEGENGLKIFKIEVDDTLELLEHDKDIIAYDVIAHPTIPGILLVATPDGYGQYKITDSNKELLSWIAP